MTHPPHPVYLPDDDWKWLQSRPGGASAAIRQLVSEARSSKRRAKAGPSRAATLYSELAKRGLVRPRREMMLGWLTGPTAQAHLRAAGVSVDEFLAEWDARHPVGGATSATKAIAPSEPEGAPPSKRGARVSGSTSIPRGRSVESPDELAAFVKGAMP